jgi:hypothetical protein
MAFLFLQCNVRQRTDLQLGKPQTPFIATAGATNNPSRGTHMNKLTWIGTIVWGAFVAGFGLSGMGTDAGSVDIQPQDVMFLIAGGMVTFLIGVIGLLGFMGWVPGLRDEQKSYS